MVKHIILWQLKDELTPSEKEIRKQKIKDSLESLPGKVPGLLELKVNIHPLPSSNADLMLDSTLDNAQALSGYAVHPEHVAVANREVRPFVKQRLCIDFEA